MITITLNSSKSKVAFAGHCNARLVMRLVPVSLQVTRLPRQCMKCFKHHQFIGGATNIYCFRRTFWLVHLSK